MSFEIYAPGASSIKASMGSQEVQQKRRTVGVSATAEAYGVHYDAAPALNVARINLALARNRLVTITKPGQYLFGGSGQGGILIPSKTTLVCAEGVELILADQTFTPLIRNTNAFDAGLVLSVAVAWFGGSPFFGASIGKTNIGLQYPVGAKFGLLGLAGSNAVNRNYQGVYTVTAATADQITFSLLGAPPSGQNSATTGIIYPADSGIKIVGGMWDGNETGQSGSPYADGDPITSIQSFRNVQNLILEGAQFRKGMAWCIGTNNVRDVTVRGIDADTKGGSVDAHDIVHIAGGARNVLIDGVTADCDDNIIGMTLDGLTNSAAVPLNAGYLSRYHPGDTYDIKIQNIHGRNGQAALVALWGNNDYRHHNTVIQRVTGQSNQGAVQVNAGYTFTNMMNVNGGHLKISEINGIWNGNAVSLKTDGAWDLIDINGVKNQSTGSATPLIIVNRSAATQTIGRLNIRNLESSTPGAPQNRDSALLQIADSNVDSFTLNGTAPVRLAVGVSLIQFSGSLGVVKQAVVEKCQAIANASGDTFVVSCENTGATALTQLTVRDNIFTGFDATGGIVRQATTGRVTRIRSDNNTQVLGEIASGIVRDNLTGGQTAVLDTVSVTTS